MGDPTVGGRRTATFGGRRLPTDAPSPRARAAALTVVGLLLAAGGHLAGGGGVSLAGVVLLAIPLSVVAGLLVRRELRLTTLLPVLIAVQLAGHFVLVIGHAHQHGALPTPDGTALAVPSGVGGLPAEALPGRAMLVGHLVAAAFAAAWLRLGESLLWRLWRAAVNRLRRWVDAPARVVVSHSAPVHVPSAPRQIGSQWHVRRGITRGPPARVVLS